MSVPRVHASPEPTIGVLGGSGFVGRSVLRRLLEAGLAAVNIDRAASDPASPAAFRRADLTDRVSLEAAFAGCTEIINLAAEWRDDVRPVERYRAVNVDGTRNVVAALKANDIRKCIFTSSVSVYGPTTHPVDEDHPPAPINPYGRSKLEAERLLFDWAAEGQGVTLAVVRPTVIFGPGNRGNVWNLLNQMANGPFLMIGDGENRKSMAFVENVAAFLLFCRQLSPGVHVFNYADGPDLTMNELVRLVRARLGRDPRIGFRVPRPAALAGAKLFDLASAVLRRPFGVTSERVFKFCANTQYSPNRALQSGFVAPVRLDEALAATIDIEFGPVRS